MFGKIYFDVLVTGKKSLNTYVEKNDYIYFTKK
jgi:hypothetical protein